MYNNIHINKIIKRERDEDDDCNIDIDDNHFQKSAKITNDSLDVQKHRIEREQRNHERECDRERSCNLYKKNMFLQKDCHPNDTKCTDYIPIKLKHKKCCVFEFNEKGSCIKKDKCIYCHNINQLIICPYGINCKNKYICNYNIHCEYERSVEFIKNLPKFKASQNIMLHKIRIEQQAKYRR